MRRKRGLFRFFGNLDLAISSICVTLGKNLCIAQGSQYSNVCAVSGIGYISSGIQLQNSFITRIVPSFSLMKSTSHAQFVSAGAV